MSSAQPITFITEEEYLEGEKHSDVKHDYYGGRVYAMAGASDAHELVAGNMFAALLGHLRGKGCRVFKSDMKLRVTFRGAMLFYYPDVMVACDPSDADPLIRERPRLIVEVLSEDWQRDLIEKAAAYSTIPTLEEYVIIDPRPEVAEVQISRRVNGWEPIEIVRGMEAEFTLHSVALTLKVAELFAV